MKQNKYSTSFIKLVSDVHLLKVSGLQPAAWSIREQSAPQLLTQSSSFYSRFSSLTKCAGLGLIHTLKMTASAEQNSELVQN